MKIYAPRRTLITPAAASCFSGRPKLAYLLPSPPAAAADTNSTNASDVLLDRDWMLPNAAAEVHRISLSDAHPGSSAAQFSYSIDRRPTRKESSAAAAAAGFYVVRDDLLHPLINGNKARKLDALIPILQQYSATDVVTCGGCQSAHAAAVAVSCAERGIRPHLLLRGEQPEVPTGYNLISLMYGNTTYVPRLQYAQREEMLNKNADLVAGNNGCVVQIDDLLEKSYNDRTAHLNGLEHDLPHSQSSEGQKRVVVVNEGAGDATALLGVVRLVRYLSQFHLFGRQKPINIVVDAGTGTTAVGLALGALCLGLPWRVTAVMLADTIERYKKREECLVSKFKRSHQLEFLRETSRGVDDSIVCWVERTHSRKFGKVLKGEIELCRQVATQTGILVDPIYTLAAWEQAVLLSLAKSEKDAEVVMLHTGGTLGMFGLAQRYSHYFHNTKPETDNF